jgi:hypothetical protein
MGKRYLRPDTGEIVEVLPGLNDNWIAGTRKPNGSIKRLKTNRIPPCEVRDVCQEWLDMYVELDKNGKWPVVMEQEQKQDLAAAKAARKKWKVGDLVRIRNVGQYDGYWGRIYCVPSAKHPNWLYNVTLLDTSQEHDCVDCRYDQMELVEDQKMAKTETTAVSTQLEFDYAANEIAAGDARSLEKHAKAICETKERVRKITAEAVLKIGSEFASAHKRLSHHGDGTFGKWCKDRCGVTHQHALRSIAAYETFGSSEHCVQMFDATSLYLLSAPACPEDATKEALKSAEDGVPVPAKLARDIIKSHSPDADDEDNEPEDAFEWQPVECLSSIRNEVKRWLNVCPADERRFILETLQDIAAQIERKANV